MNRINKPKLKPIASFQINYLQYLNENREAIQPFPEFADEKTLLALYRWMTLVRTLDNKAVNLQRQGKMGTYPSSRGQEAVSVGTGHAMNKNDVFCTYYRDQGAMIVRGVKLSEILLYWGGDERGSNFSDPNVKEDLPICVPIAGQCLHATGVAFAIAHRGENRAVVTTIGEGGTSKGDFYEAMNLAGAWNLPLVFVVNNNQWAISVPRNQQTACKTIAQKAIAAGIEGIQVDGNDVIAVRHAVSVGIEKAKKGQGASLIEAVTYRLCDHTTADDASRYIPKEDFKTHWQKEPIARLGYYLESKGLWSKEKEASLQQECHQLIETAVKEYLAIPPQKKTAIFDYLYDTLPDPLIDQYEQINEASHE